MLRPKGLDFGAACAVNPSHQSSSNGRRSPSSTVNSPGLGKHVVSVVSRTLGSPDSWKSEGSSRKRRSEDVLYAPTPKILEVDFYALPEDGCLTGGQIKLVFKYLGIDGDYVDLIGKPEVRELLNHLTVKGGDEVSIDQKLTKGLVLSGKVVDMDVRRFCFYLCAEAALKRSYWSKANGYEDKGIPKLRARYTLIKKFLESQEPRQYKVEQYLFHNMLRDYFRNQGLREGGLLLINEISVTYKMDADRGLEEYVRSFIEVRSKKISGEEAEYRYKMALFNYQMVKFYLKKRKFSKAGCIAKRMTSTVLKPRAFACCVLYLLKQKRAQGFEEVLQVYLSGVENERIRQSLLPKIVLFYLNCKQPHIAKDYAQEFTGKNRNRLLAKVEGMLRRKEVYLTVRSMIRDVEDGKVEEVS